MGGGEWRAKRRKGLVRFVIVLNLGATGLLPLPSSLWPLPLSSSPLLRLRRRCFSLSWWSEAGRRRRGRQRGRRGTTAKASLARATGQPDDCMRTRPLLAHLHSVSPSAISSLLPPLTCDTTACAPSLRPQLTPPTPTPTPNPTSRDALAPPQPPQARAPQLPAAGRRQPRRDYPQGRGAPPRRRPAPPAHHLAQH